MKKKNSRFHSRIQISLAV